MLFRDGGIGDTAQLADVFYAAVREGPSPYTEAQRAAWLPDKPTAEAFARRIADMHVVVAEDRHKIVGFMSLKRDGYIALTFILSHARGQGAFRHMYEMIELQASRESLERLWTHASLMAQPAFRRVGFSVIQHEQINRSGEILPRVEMEKTLI